MGTGFGEGESQDIVFDEVYQKPIGLNVAFVETAPFPLQFMVTVFDIEFLPVPQGIDDMLQEI